MKYSQVLELIKDEGSSFYLSVPGLVQLGKVSQPCRVRVEPQLALSLINAVLEQFTDNNYTVDTVEFQVACSGKEVILLLNPAFTTVH